MIGKAKTRSFFGRRSRSYDKVETAQIVAAAPDNSPETAPPIQDPEDNPLFQMKRVGTRRISAPGRQMLYLTAEEYQKLWTATGRPYYEDVVVAESKVVCRYVPEPVVYTTGDPLATRDSMARSSFALYLLSNGLTIRGHTIVSLSLITPLEREILFLRLTDAAWALGVATPEKSRISRSAARFWVLCGIPASENIEAIEECCFAAPARYVKKRVSDEEK